MAKQNLPREEEETKEPLLIQKDKSLLKMGLILGGIILVMGYLTFFVDDPASLFKSKKKAEPVKAEQQQKESSALLDETLSMTDDEVRSSLVKFIEAFYYDERRGYFDAPSYFATITETFYNYHNLTYDRVKDLYWQRRKDQENLRRNWIVSSLKFDRDGERITAIYWVKESYYQPSLHQQYSANVQYEMIINEDGKIVSLRDIDVSNEKVEPFAPDSSNVTTEGNTEPIANETVSDTKVYQTTELDVQPEFNGGQKELIKYVSSNIRYPSSARQNNIQGKVVVAFIIERDGSVSDIKVQKGIGAGCDEEAVRLIKNSPKWRPGVLKSTIVRTNYLLPITFQLAQ